MKCAIYVQTTVSCYDQPSFAYNFSKTIATDASRNVVDVCKLNFDEKSKFLYYIRYIPIYVSILLGLEENVSRIN